MRKLSPHLLRRVPRNYWVLAAFAAVFVGAGVVLVLHVFASAGPVGFEAKSGTPANGAKSVSVSGASGGSAIKFGSNASPAASPSTTSFPDASNTGVPSSVKLVVINHANPSPAGLASDNTGWHYDTDLDRVVFDSSGAVMDGVDLETGTKTYGDLPDNITIKNSRIRCQAVGSFCVAVANGGLVEDSDLGGGDSGTQFQGATTLYSSGSASSPATVLRTKLHSAPQNLKSDGYLTVQDSYLYGSPGWNDSWTDPSTGLVNLNTHTDQIFIDAAIDVILTHDTLVGGDNSTIDFTGAHSATSGSAVQNCYFVPDLGNGTNPGHYGIGGGGVSGGLRIIDNTFGVGYAQDAIQHGFTPAPTISGNVWTDGTGAD